MKYKTILLFLFIGLFSYTSYCQDKQADEIKTLYEAKEYDKIIKQFSKTKDLSALALYYVGSAYFMKEDDNACLRFIDLSLEKDATFASAHHIRGSALIFLKRYEDAVKSFRLAISIDPSVSLYYSSLGDAYNNLDKIDLALEAYIKATEQKDPIERAFSMVAQLYSEQKKNDKSLEAYYVAKQHISKESPSYITALYNIGLFESMNQNYEKAEAAFTELLLLSPEDYHTYAKLIQVYYARKEYAKAKPYKDKLYAASKKGLLKDNLKNMFCFDQFKWNGTSIQAFERFEEGDSKEIYNKHIFYILDKNGEIDFRIQTEYSPISAELGGPKYLLCMSKGGSHYTFNVGFNDNLKYEELKQSVIDVLEEKIKAGASSQPGK